MVIRCSKPRPSDFAGYRRCPERYLDDISTRLLRQALRPDPLHTDLKINQIPTKTITLPKWLNALLNFYKKSKAKAPLPAELPNLPIDLIEKILFESANPNLHLIPESIRTHLRWTTDGPELRGLILLAFFNNDGMGPVNSSLFHPLAYQQLSSSTRYHLQRAVLELPACTFGQIKECIDDLFKLELINQRNICIQRRGLIGIPDINRLDDLKTRYSQRLSPNRAPPEIPQTLLRRVTIPLNAQNRKYPLKDAVTFCCVPSRALDPPTWSRDATEYLLFILQRLGPRPLGISVPDMDKGFETAILEHKADALYFLCSLRLALDFPTSTRQRGHHIPQRLFALACQQEVEHSIWIIALLWKFRSDFYSKSPTNLPVEVLGKADMPVLKRWARRLCKDDNSSPEGKLGMDIVNVLSGYSGVWLFSTIGYSVLFTRRLKPEYLTNLVWETTWGENQRMPFHDPGMQDGTLDYDHFYTFPQLPLDIDRPN